MLGSVIRLFLHNDHVWCSRWITWAFHKYPDSAHLGTREICASHPPGSPHFTSFLPCIFLSPFSPVSVIPELCYLLELSTFRERFLYDESWACTLLSPRGHVLSMKNTGLPSEHEMNTFLFCSNNPAKWSPVAPQGRKTLPSVPLQDVRGNIGYRMVVTCKFGAERKVQFIQLTHGWETGYLSLLMTTQPVLEWSTELWS